MELSFFWDSLRYPVDFQRENVAYFNAVKLLLDSKADLNEQKKKGFTALMIVSAKGHRDIVAALLAAKVDVNIQKKNGATALIIATAAGH